ncbi:MAG: hypothetical protein R3C11_19450 [Planctomycetaceae bacterium]
MIKRRDELYLERQQLLSKFTENHPRVKSLDEQIQEAEEILKQTETKRAELNEDNNPTYLKLQETNMSEAEAIGLRARQARLEEQFTGFRKRADQPECP